MKLTAAHTPVEEGGMSHSIRTNNFSIVQGAVQRFRFNFIVVGTPSRSCFVEIAQDIGIALDEYCSNTCGLRHHICRISPG